MIWYSNIFYVFNSEDEGNDVEPGNFSEGVDFGNHRLPIFADNVINENIRSLNEKQRQVFDGVHKWSKDYIKNVILGHPNL